MTSGVLVYVAKKLPREHDYVAFRPRFELFLTDNKVTKKVRFKKKFDLC